MTVAILLDEYHQSRFKKHPQLHVSPPKTPRTLGDPHQQSQGLIPFSVALSKYRSPHSQLLEVASAATVTASPARVPAASTASRSWMAKNQRRPRCKAVRVLGDATGSWVEDYILPGSMEIQFGILDFATKNVRGI